jgi:signal transduction histidine kinase
VPALAQGRAPRVPFDERRPAKTSQARNPENGAKRAEAAERVTRPDAMSASHPFHQPSRHTLLVVAEEPQTRATLRTVLEREGHQVLSAENGPAALAFLGAEPIHLVLLAGLPLGALADLVRAIRGRDALVPVVVRGADVAEKGRIEALRQLPVEGYQEPRDGSARLLLVVDTALRAHDEVLECRVGERLKTELLASASHEFRTPLNVILGYLELVRDGAYGDCGDALRGVLGTLERNASYLLELVEGFLDLAKLESSTLALEVVDVAAIVRALASDHALLLGERPIALRVEVAPDLPPVRADAAKVRVVVQNLLANALKFTERGEVAVVAAPACDGTVQVRVCDTGPGIPPEARDTIFELFRQLHPNDPRRKGVGLGLALARRFARAMGGELTVESTLGRGSTFTLSLPAAEAARPALSFAGREA